MRLLVLGAAGPTGRHVVAQAVDQGHAVTAFVRPSHAVPSEPPVTVVTGDATNPDDLGRALPGHDAVISTLGRGLRLRSEGLMERAARALVLAMERLGPKRLIFLSAFGVGDSARGAPLLPRLMFRLILRDIYADKALADDLVRRSALDWTLIHPTQLTNGPRTGRYHFGDSLRLRGVPRISRADTAGFLLSCLTDPSTVRRSLFVSY